MYTDPANQQEWEQHLGQNAGLLPVRRMYAVAPNDAVDLPHGVCRAVYATTAGTVMVTPADNDPATEGPFPINLAAGEMKAISCRRIWNTNTTIAGASLFVMH